MLFTAPSFAFLFLPLAVFFVTVIGKKYRRSALLIVFSIYHAFLYIEHPIYLLYPTGLIAYCYGVAVLLRQKQIPWLSSLIRHPSVFGVLTALPYAAPILNHIAAYYGSKEFDFPTGLTVTVICSTVFLLDAYRARSDKKVSLMDLSLYLLFFPVKIVGPVLRYGHFCDLMRESQLRPKLSVLARGIRIYAIGLIKRIAIGAPLMEAYLLFSDLAGRTPDVIVVVYLLILIYFSTFFAVTGYLDMGVGIATMLGIRMERKNRNPFRISTPLQYLQMLFGSICDRVDEWVIPEKEQKQHKGLAFLRALCYTSGVLLLIRPSMYVLALSVPLTVLVWLCLIHRPEHSLRSRTALRVVCAFLTMAMFSFVWMLMTQGTTETLWDYVTALTWVNTEYHLNLIMNSFSALKYLLILLLAVFVLHPRLGGAAFHADGQDEGEQKGVSYGINFLILSFFLLTLLFFLPQFPVYNETPFAFLYS